MEYLLFIFLIIIIGISFVYCNSIFTPYFYSLGYYSMMINFGKIKNVSRLYQIDIQNTISMASSPNHLLDIADSNLGRHYINVNSKEIVGKKYKFTLGLYGIIQTISNFSLFILDEEEEKNNYVDFISLAYMTKNYSDSLIMLLKSYKFMDKLKFSFIDQKLYFGEPPKETKENLYKGECEIQNNKWGCNIKSIYIDNVKVFDVNSYSLLSTSESKIFVPKEFFQMIGDKVMKEYIDKKICSLYENKGVPYYLCNCGAIVGFPKIKFEIGHFIFELKTNTIFEEFDGFCFFLFEENNKGNYFILGSPFLKTFSEEFDFEKGIVTFYSRYPNIITTNETNRNFNPLIQLSLIINMIMLLMHSCFICICHLYQKKNQIINK